MYEFFKIAALFTLFSFAVVMVTGPRTSRADGGTCNAERRDFYRGWRTDWPAQCGRQPDAKYLEGMRQDCAHTIANITHDIATGGVGAWQANWSGVYSQESCMALEFGNEL